MSIAYGLKADYEGTVEQDGATVPRFRGGVISIAGGRSLDVAAELDAGDGRIVVDPSDFPLVNALDGYEPLKRVAAGDAEVTTRTLDELGQAELRTEARNRGLATGGSNEELRARILAHDAAVAAGDGEGANDPNPEA